LRPLLAGRAVGETIEDSPALREWCSTLERYLPELLREIHPEWERESLDGIYPEIASKSGEFEIELAGLCILISDQSVAPLYLRLQIDSHASKVTWLDCKLGEAGPDGLVRTPYNRRRMLAKPSPPTDWARIAWFYHLGFGERVVDIA
jgi:hypothetical protein